MAALTCELCGGKLMGRPGGIFECDSCGMEYDSAWAKEKIQEIKGSVKVEGTVQVEGTVEVTGSVKVEGSVTAENLLSGAEWRWQTEAGSLPMSFLTGRWIPSPILPRAGWASSWPNSAARMRRR